MSRLHFSSTLLAAGLLAGVVLAACSLTACSAPETRPTAASPARTAPALPAITPPPVAAPVDAEAALVARLHALAPRADIGMLALAVEARACALRDGAVSEAARLAVIDYSRPSTEPRLWVFDVAGERLMHEELVAHGQGTGENIARHFSN